jgi:hypothetical protein
MGERVYGYVRRHHLGLVAIFIALGGTAWAGAKLGAEDIQKNAIRAKHVKNDRIGTAEVADDDSPKTLTGEDIEESTLNDVDAETLDGAGASAFVPVGRLRNTGRVAVDDPLPGENNGSATVQLLNRGPFLIRGLCGQNSDGGVEEASIELVRPANSSVTGVRQNISGSINSAAVATPFDLLPVAGAVNSIGSVDFLAVAPNGAALRATGVVEVNDAQAPGSDCTFALTAIAP